MGDSAGTNGLRVLLLLRTLRPAGRPHDARRRGLLRPSRCGRPADALLRRHRAGRGNHRRDPLPPPAPQEILVLVHRGFPHRSPRDRKCPVDTDEHPPGSRDHRGDSRDGDAGDRAPPRLLLGAPEVPHERCRRLPRHGLSPSAPFDQPRRHQHRGPRPARTPPRPFRAPSYRTSTTSRRSRGASTSTIARSVPTSA